MEEQNNTPPEDSPSAVKVGGSKGRGSKAVLWLLVVIVALLLAAAGFLFWQLQAAKDKEQQLNADKQQLQEKLDKLEKAAGTEQKSANAAGSTETCDDEPSAEMKANIKAALDSKNTAVFTTYTTDPVNYILAASEYGGDISAAEAATSLDYTHSATGPWDFELPQATLDGYAAGFYTDYFDEKTYVGKAASGMVAAFNFDCDGKVSQIFIAADESILE